MYKISDEQIDYIINDIRARGVEMESLQNDLVDHVCCIVEQQLEATGDFERFYDSVIKTFYKKELKEIEEETKSLLKNKNYYVMKKVMITSGIISAVLLTIGIIFKFLHMPGAAVGIVTGIASFSFIFLPLMFALKIKEKQQTKDKVLLAIGSVVTILMSLAVLFKIMHWPYANMMGLTSVGILFLLYLPINLVTGIRNPETKVNTIVSSILLVAGCGLFLSLARSPQGSKNQYIKETNYFLKNELLFKIEQQQLSEAKRQLPLPATAQDPSTEILDLCENLKSYIIEKETGHKSIGVNFEADASWLSESYVAVYFPEGSDASKKYQSLVEEIKVYNGSIQSGSSRELISIPEPPVLVGKDDVRVTEALNRLVQLQLFVIQNQRALLLNK